LGSTNRLQVCHFSRANFHPFFVVHACCGKEISLLFTMRIEHVPLLAVVLLMLVAAPAWAEDGGDTDGAQTTNEAHSAPIACACKCCYLGSCKRLNNATYVISSCQDCSIDLCKKYVASASVKERVAAMLSDVAHDKTGDGAEKAAEEEVSLDVCEMISVIEHQNCMGNPECKRSTELKPECISRDAPFLKYCVVFYVLALTLLTSLGFVKNYIPVFQEINSRHFDY
jgi:hypothetical protein